MANEETNEDVESDLELDNEGVVAPDNEEPQMVRI